MSENKFQVLFVDDEPDSRKSLLLAFSDRFEFTLAQTPDQMYHYLESGKRFDLMLLDLELEKGSGDLVGLRLIKEILDKQPNLPIIVVTKDDKQATIKTAMDGGAVDFLMKGKYDKPSWQNAFEKAIKNAALSRNQSRQQHFNSVKDNYAFISVSPKIAEVREVLQYVSNTPNTPLLIMGETGTGKEVAAKHLHSISPRKYKPLITAELSSHSDGILESEMFGHVKGAFTGAERDREGWFRQANGGILMLDEIGEINEDIQKKLLRFLQEKTIKPVGSDKEVKLDVQIIAATNKNLEQLVREGKFRQDLYMRLKSMSLVLPPLRERKEDIPLLMKHYLGDSFDAQEAFSSDAWVAIMQYSWPGNIREIQQAITPILYGGFQNGGHLITVDCLPKEILENHPIEPAQSSHETPRSSIGAPDVAFKGTRPRLEALSLLNLQYIENALHTKNKVKQDVADMLLYKSADSLLYDIKTCYRDFPNLFDDNAFPTIKAAYPQIFKH